jgi:hypothetical protein
MTRQRMVVVITIIAILATWQYITRDWPWWIP